MGCVSIGCLAQNGHSVIGVDVVQNKVDLINQGKPTIIEKDIDKILMEQHANGNVSATIDSHHAVLNSEVSIICVGTPSTDEGHLNLKYVFEVARQIGDSLSRKDTFHVVIIRSTVFPGTNSKVGEIIADSSGKKRDEHFTVVSNPEFLREGSAVHDYYNPAVTVIGSDNHKAIEITSELYEKINAPIEVTDIQIAELIKYINNTYHALKIVFGNEVGNICKKLGIDSHKVMELFCKDDQLNISSKYFKPGFAYGGSCLPKDLKGLKTIAHDHYLDIPVINAIDRSNEHHLDVVYKKIVSSNAKSIGVLGLSFKAGTDDLRYSPSVEIVERLLGKGYQVSIFDQNVDLSKITGTNKDYIDQHIPHLADIITGNLKSVIDSSELIVITQNNESFTNLHKSYPDKKFLDLVRINDETSLENFEGICW